MNAEKLNSFLKQIKSQFANEQLLIGKAQCWTYGYDYSKHHVCPDVVFFPHSEQDVVKIVTSCFQHNIPITARGTATGIVGGAVPLQGGVVISFERMAKIINTDIDNRVVSVEPGVINQDLQQHLQKFDFFWPPDPSSKEICTIGGNLANNSAGPRAVKYGTPRENTLALTAVIGTGEIIHTGVYTTKGVVGFDLTRLLIGSEGLLGIITTAHLKVTPLAQSKTTMRALYDDLTAATQAVAKIMAQPITPYCLEFLDHACIKLISEKINLPAQTRAMLIIEIDGQTVAMPSMQHCIQQAATNSHLIDFQIANDPQQIANLWSARKALSPMLRDIAPKKINEDIVVPVANLAELITFIEKLAKQQQIAIVNFGHAGNGNIHVNILIDPNDPRQLQAAKICLDQIFDKVLQLKGSLSGEHGVGIDKQTFIGKEIDTVSLRLMKQIKQQFDPKNILNPGKLL